MNPLASILSAIQNIHRLKSRAPRSEYWWVFALLFFGVIGATMIADCAPWRVTVFFHFVLRPNFMPHLVCDDPPAA